MKIIVLSLIYISIFVPVFGQSIEFFDIDASAFPIMRAKFLAIDENGEQVNNVKIQDLSVKEEGNVRRIISVTCNNTVELEPVSTVLVMDASGSMARRNLDLAKTAAAAWINGMPDGESECAITAFNLDNYMIQDFTSNKPLLLLKVKELFARGGTNYNAAFFEEIFGGLLVTRYAKHDKKVIVMMTDGMATTTTLENLIIDMAMEQQVVIYVVTLGMPCPEVLRNIAMVTGGQWFENVSTPKETSDIYNQILQIISGAEPCQIVWESDVSCFGGERLADIDFYPFNTNKFITYTMPPNHISGIVLSPESVFFKNVLPGTVKDTTVTITALNGDLIVSDIMWDNPAFEVYPRSFKIKKGEIQPLKVTYTAPAGGEYIWSRVDIFNNLCPSEFYASGGFAGKRPEKPTLMLTHPNGGELFVAGNDTVITWEGIPNTDTVRLEYSHNNGQSWLTVSENAVGGKYDWIRIPRTPSTECLMKVSQLNMDVGSNPEWVRGFGGDSYFNIELPHSGIALDLYGNIYITSQFTDRLVIDGKVLESQGETDVFIAKIDPSGKLEWITQLGSPYHVVSKGIAVDVFGNSFVAGKFDQFLNYDNRTLNSHGGRDIFIVKLLPDGNVQWAKNPGGTGDDFANDIHIDHSYNLIITGAFSRTAYFDKLSVASQGGYDMFIAKYTPEGNCLWVKANGGLYHDEGTAVATTSAGTIYATGKFSKIAKFGNVTLTSSGNSTEFADFEVYVAKYFANGTMEWVVQAGGEGYDEAFGIATDSFGDAYITGSFTHKANFGVHELTPASTGDNITSDIFISKILSNGKFYWARSAGGNSNDAAYDIAVDVDGNPVITGAFTGSANFGETSLTGQGFLEVFAAKYTTMGELVWAKRAGGQYGDVGLSLALDSWGNSFITGNYTNGGEFGGKITKSRAGMMDVFVWGAGGGNDALQEDVSNTLWTIAAPKAVAKDVDMGEIYLGTVKDSSVFDFIRNTGSYDFKVDTIFFVGADKDVFSIVSKKADFIVEQNSEQEIEFRYNPIKAGRSAAEVVIHTQYDTIRKNIVGVGLLPDIQLIHRNINFGKVFVGEFKDSLLVAMIANNSNQPVEFTSTRHNKPNDKDFTTLLGGGEFILQPGDTAWLDLRFTPSDKGRTGGTLEFHYKGAGSPAVIQLAGEGINPNASVMVSNSSFDDIFCEKTTFSDVQISNKGGDTLEVYSIEFAGNNASDFSVQQDFPIEIAPDKTVLVRVDYYSDIPGIKTADMVVRSNSMPDSLHYVPLSLMLNGAKAVAEKSILDLGILDLDEPAETTINIENPGNYTSLFVVSTGDKITSDKQTFLMLPKQKSEIKVTFEGSNSEGIFESNITIVDTLCKFETHIAVNAVISKRERPMISVISRDFGIIQCETERSEIFSISNRGKEELIISSIDIQGADKDDFEFELPGIMFLKQNESTDFTVHFKPQSAGLKRAELVIISNSEVNSENIIPVSGMFEPSNFNVSENEINLGKIKSEQAVNFSFNITNTGSKRNKFYLSKIQDITFEKYEVDINSGQSEIINGQFISNIKQGILSGNILVFDSICDKQHEIIINASIAADAILTLIVGSSEGFAGDRIEIPIAITNFENPDNLLIENIDFDLSFNSTILLPDFVADYTDIKGRGKLKLKDIPFKSDGNLILIPFIVGLGNSETTDISISNIATSENEVSIFAESGLFTSLGICYEGGSRLFNPNGTAGIMQISPNPVSDKTVNISFNLIEKGTTKIGIYNSNGYLKEEIDVTGKTGIINLQFQTNQFESGMYFIQLTTPTIFEIQKLIIVK
jgi:uncharacterized protein YegL